MTSMTSSEFELPASLEEWAAWRKRCLIGRTLCEMGMLSPAGEPRGPLKTHQDLVLQALAVAIEFGARDGYEIGFSDGARAERFDRYRLNGDRIVPRS
jgi:hypothetical protein